MAKVTEEKAKALVRCNKCGFCLAHCPIYKVTGVESSAARGRIALIRSALLDDRLELREVEDAASDCLTCNACLDDCPAGVKTSDIIFSAREELRKQSGDSLIDRLLFQKLLASPSLLRSASRLLGVADRAGLRSAARKTGLLRLMGDAGRASAIVPRVSADRGLRAITRLTGKVEKPRYRVAYFAGCHAANLAPERAAATVRILQRHQVEVVVPEFVCCGLPAAGHGDMSSARSLAQRNVEIGSRLKVDAIVTSCASCNSFLKEYGKLLADEPQRAEKAAIFKKVRDLSEFLVDIGLVMEMGTVKKRVTYHDPCHFAHYQKIKQQPRTILKSIPGVEFSEMKEADMCCGAAGTYAFRNYDLSMKVLARKMSNVEKTGADMLVSSCPACVMQLSFGVSQQKMPVQVLDIVELLDHAYQTAKGVR